MLNYLIRSVLLLIFLGQRVKLKLTTCVYSITVQAKAAINVQVKLIHSELVDTAYSFQLV